MSTSETSGRRVRPWLAALLTIFGWGVGFYYARRSGLAWLMAWLSVAIGIAVGAGAVAFFLLTGSASEAIYNPAAPTWLDAINWALLLLVAIIAWIVAAKRKEVERASPARLLGYLAVCLVPIVISLAAAFALRAGVAQPFHIPSGAMQPTLQVGDYVIVTKNSYGYSRFSAAPFESLLPAGRIQAHEPERGDVVVFRPVPEPDRDFVKRLIGLPGDRVQMISGVLHINGEAVTREPLGPMTISSEYENVTADSYRETLPNGASYTVLDRVPNGELDNTRVFVVPEGHYFLLGDDRDNSADSRVPSVVGYVPFDTLIGRVDYLKRAGSPVRRLN